MIRRHPPRSTRGQYQDFHFFAGSQPSNSFEPRSFAPPQSESPSLPSHLEPSEGAIATGPGQPEPLEAAPAPTKALERALEYLVRTDGPAAFPELAEPPALDQIEDWIEDHREEQMKAQIEAAPAKARRPRKAIKRSEKKRMGATTETADTARRVRKSSRPPRLAIPRKTRAGNSASSFPSTSPRTQHESQCTICSHPLRAEIENEFMHWHSVNHIAYDYEISRSAIYRHAYAERLFARRNRELRFALGHIIERAQDLDPTADTVVRAIHLFARINDAGECIEPPAHVIVSSGGIHREAALGSARHPIAISLDSPALAGTIDMPSQPLLSAPEPAADDGRKGGTLNRPEDHATR